MLIVRRFLAVALAAAGSLVMTGAALAAKPEIVSVEKIWDAGKHNAFTDLIRWNDKWYCTFREADAHVGGDGQLRVLESTDGKEWKSAALIGEKGIDLRDPKLSITPDGRLMIVGGGSVYEGKTLKGRQPRVTFSKDGHEWTAPRRVLEEGDWLWRVTWHDGKAYGVSYDASQRSSADAKEAAKTGKVAPGPADWKLKLFQSDDGVKYELITHLDVPGNPNETTLRFLPSGEMIALVRREAGNKKAWIGRSKAPYKEWTWHETEHQVGGPNFIRLPDGALWAVGRSYPGGAKTALATMTADGDYDPVLTFPSGGDTSYAGLVWHDGLLWVSYYSSHEGKTSIYLAQIKLPTTAEKIGSRLEPFVDDYLIDQLEGGAALKVQQPTPREVVLVADKPWEGNTSAYYTVLSDGEKFRMYYRGSHFDEKTKKSTHAEVTCYAESEDGLHWTKPELGLIEFDGSKQNNIVWKGAGGHNFTPFLDTRPGCPQEARFKAVAGIKGGLLPLQSADGVRWTPMSDKPVITKGAFDSQNLAFWDGHMGKYREYHRIFSGGVRDIATGVSDDFLHWSDPVPLEITGAPREHLYTNAILPHPGAPHILVGFPTRFLPKTQQTEPTFMASRDGLRFHRYEQPIIPTTAPQNRDGNRSNYMAWGVVRLPGDKDLSVFAKEAYYTGPASRVRRFTYRTDGFVALAAGPEGGEAMLRPVSFDGDKLVLNYRTGKEGSVRVELLDAEGSPISGYALDHAAPLNGDDTAGVVQWKEGASVAGLAGKEVRLRFVLKDAELFSFRFQ